MASTIKLKNQVTKLEAAKKAATKGKNTKLAAKFQSQIEVLNSQIKALNKPTGSPAVQAAKQLAREYKAKYGVNFNGIDIEKDAKIPALKMGRRISQGLKGNGTSSKEESKGNVYYEYRENHLDRNAKRYPKLEDGGVMAKGGRITKGSKYLMKFNTSKGDSGYSILEVVDTNYFSNQYGGSPNTIRTKVIESSNGKVGEFDEHSRNSIQTYLKNGLWQKLDHYTDGGVMAERGWIEKPMTGGRKKYVKESNDYKHEIFKKGDGKYYVSTTILSSKSGVDEYSQTYESNISDDFNSLEEAKKYVSNKYADGGVMAKGGVTEKELEKVTMTVYNFLTPLGYSARVEKSIGPVLYMVEPSTRKVGNNRSDFFDGMQILAIQDGTFEVSEYQAGENENELYIYKVTSSLTLALKDLIKGNKRKPIKKYADGGSLDSILLDTGGASSSDVGGTLFSNADLTPQMDITNPMFAKGGKLNNYKYVPNRMIQAVEVERNGRETEIDGANVIDGLYVKKGVKFANGGSISNQYKGLTDEVLWDSWKTSQKTHFLQDHYDSYNEYGELNKYRVEGLANMEFNELPSVVKKMIKEHRLEGQYANGGETHRGEGGDMYAMGGNTSNFKVVIYSKNKFNGGEEVVANFRRMGDAYIALSALKVSGVNGNVEFSIKQK